MKFIEIKQKKQVQTIIKSYVAMLGIVEKETTIRKIVEELLEAGFELGKADHENN